jgi:20S proteasome alpha/beta subunit
MTIALGFFYDKGVLVCADSQFTIGTAKLDGQKTGRFSASWGTVVAAIEGNGDYASAAFNECIHLKESESFRKDPIQAMRELLETRYKNNVWAHPDYASQNYDYSFLFGIYLNGAAGARLYKTNDGVLRPLTAFECIGCGEQFGRDVAKLVYRYRMTHESAVFSAAYVLSHANERSQFVGGQFRFLILKHDGSVIEEPESHKFEAVAFHAANVGNWFIQECQRFLVMHADGDSSYFSDLLKALNSRAGYVHQLKVAIESGSKDPRSTTVDRHTRCHGRSHPKGLMNPEAKGQCRKTELRHGR